MSDSTSVRDPNFVPGGTIGVIEQLDLIDARPITVAIVDGAGDQITSFGGGTQYADGAARGSAIGTIAMGDDGTNIQSVHVDSSGDLQIDVLTMPSVAVTSATFATSAKQDTGNTSLSSIDGKLPALGQALAASSVPVVLTAAQITTLTPPAAITGYATLAEQQTQTTALQTIDNAVSGAGFNITQLGGVNVSMNTGVRDTGTQRVTIATNDSVPVTFTGSTDVATQTTLASALTSLQTLDNAISGSGFNITQMNGEAIDVGAGTEAAAIRVTLPTNGTGILAGVTTVTTVSTVTALTGGGIAHDSADSGNPHKMGMKAFSPDGTTPGTAVAENDRTDAKGDLDGRLFVNDEHPRWGSYHEDSSNALTDAEVAAAPGAGFQVVITNIIVSTGAATALNFFLEEATTKKFGPIYLEAVAGRGFCTPAGFKKHITANTAVTITTSAAIAHSVDIQYIIQAV